MAPPAKEAGPAPGAGAPPAPAKGPAPGASAGGAGGASGEDGPKLAVLGAKPKKKAITFAKNAIDRCGRGADGGVCVCVCGGGGGG